MTGVGCGGTARGGGIFFQKQLLDPCKLLGGGFGKGGVGTKKIPEDRLIVGNGCGHVVKMALELFG